MTNDIKEYTWDDMPKYIQWKKNRSTTYYYAPLIFKNEKGDGYRDVYIAMYARQYFRSTGLCFRLKECLFQVTAGSFVDALMLFKSEYLYLVKMGIINGCMFCEDKVDDRQSKLLNANLYYDIQSRRQCRKYAIIHKSILSCVILFSTLLFSNCSSNEPYPIKPPVPPTASFSYQVKQPLSVALTNTSVNASSYVWDFGDGKSSTEKNPIHRYDSKGVYKIKLTAKASGLTDIFSSNVTIENPTKIYISGFKVSKIPYQNQYYYIKVIDDDFFTTTWVKTKHFLLSNANLPYSYMLANPVLMDGLSEDNYYMMQLWYSTTSTGTGTKVGDFKMTKAQILAYPDALTGTNDNVSLTTFFTYK